MKKSNSIILIIVVVFLTSFALNNSIKELILEEALSCTEVPIINDFKDEDRIYLEYKLIFKQNPSNFEIYTYSFTWSHTNTLLAIIKDNEINSFDFIDYEKDSVILYNILKENLVEDKDIIFLDSLTKDLHKSNRVKWKLLVENKNKRKQK